MNKKYTKKSGFTLPELLVAMTVIVLVIYTSTNLVVSIIRSNTENLDTMIAYGLAQEGLEGVRNMRDSNWLLGAQFDGQLKGFSIWGDTFNKTEEEQFYIIDLNALEKSPGAVESAGALQGYTPWVIEQINQTDFESDKTKIKKFIIDEQTKEFRYGHYVGLSTGEDTLFSRYLMIKKVPTPYEKPGEVHKYRVACIVEWMEGGRHKSVRLDTELTDWYEAQ